MFARALLVGLAVIGLSSPLFAGAPDNPGAGGQAVKEFVQETKQDGTPPGQVIKDFDPPLGQLVQEAKDFLGGAPNPANDKGKGND